MDFFKERDLNSYVNQLKNVFNIISLTQKYKVIGSSNLKNMRYNSDFDLADFYNYSRPDIHKIRKYFQHIYRTLDVKKYNSYITDFKCGLNSDGEPLKWNKNEIKKNEKILLNGDKITLDEALTHKSTIKIDVVCFINNTFVEISENYYIKLGDISNFDEKELTEKNIITSIKTSENDEIKDDNYNKALKRQFSWRYALNKNDPKLIKLTNFFNSSVGILNKARSDIDTLLLLLETIPTVKINHILSAIDNVKFQCSYNTIEDFTNSFLKLEKIKSKKLLEKLLISLREQIYKIVNEYSKKFYSPKGV